MFPTNEAPFPRDSRTEAPIVYPDNKVIISARPGDRANDFAPDPDAPRDARSLRPKLPAAEARKAAKVGTKEVTNSLGFVPDPVTGKMLATSKAAADEIYEQAGIRVDVMTVDRIVPGKYGGIYSKTNIIPVAPEVNYARKADASLPSSLGSPSWGDPVEYGQSVITANPDKVAAAVASKRDELLATPKYNGVHPDPDLALPDDWDGRVSFSVRFDRFGVNAESADGVEVADLGLRHPEGPYQRFVVDELFVGGVEVVGVVPSDPLRFHDGSGWRGEVGGHGTIVEFANPWRDERGRFAEKGYHGDLEERGHLLGDARRRSRAPPERSRRTVGRRRRRRGHERDR